MSPKSQTDKILVGATEWKTSPCPKTLLLPFKSGVMSSKENKKDRPQVWHVKELKLFLLVVAFINDFSNISMHPLMWSTLKGPFMSPLHSSLPRNPSQREWRKRLPVPAAPCYRHRDGERLLSERPVRPELQRRGSGHDAVCPRGAG